MTKKEFLSEPLSVADALRQASVSLRGGDLPGAVYWVRVAADLEEDEQAAAAE